MIGLRPSFFIIIIGLLISLTIVGEAQEFQCNELFSKDRHSQLYVKSVEARGASRLYAYLTAGNIEKIFTHNYERGKAYQYGAKAVVVSLPGKSPLVYFFATGEGTLSWSIHHLSAVETALGLSRSFDLRSQIPLDQLPFVQGYEFTAEKWRGQWRIVKLSIQSQITTLKLNRFLKPDLRLEQELLDLLISRIDPSLIQFTTPQVELIGTR
ncbi:MAG: hypothetical protein K2Q26_06785 [Bdellovibrionales bacterium]|nr:hypothetical protein [Bdellovibrionales bacterium]